MQHAVMLAVMREPMQICIHALDILKDFEQNYSPVLTFSCEDMLFEFAGPGGDGGNGTAAARFDILWAPAAGKHSAQFHPLDNSQSMRVVCIPHTYTVSQNKTRISL